MAWKTKSIHGKPFGKDVKRHNEAVSYTIKEIMVVHGGGPNEFELVSNARAGMDENYMDSETTAEIGYQWEVTREWEGKGPVSADKCDVEVSSTPVYKIEVTGGADSDARAVAGGKFTIEQKDKVIGSRQLFFEVKDLPPGGGTVTGANTAGQKHSFTTAVSSTVSPHTFLIKILLHTYASRKNNANADVVSTLTSTVGVS